jgi:hypothetical protein
MALPGSTPPLSVKACRACGSWLIKASPWPCFDQKLSLTTDMITRSRASYVSALDPSCPVKSEEPPFLT